MIIFNFGCIFILVSIVKGDNHTRPEKNLLELKSKLTDKPIDIICELLFECHNRNETIIYRLARESKEAFEKAEKEYNFYCEKIDLFFLTNPSYQDRYETNTIRVDNWNISLPLALQYFLLYKYSKKSLIHLMEDNFIIKTKYDEEYEPPYIVEIDLNKAEYDDDEIDEKAKKLGSFINGIKKCMNDLDLSFVELIHNIYIDINKKMDKYILNYYGITEIVDIYSIPELIFDYPKELMNFLYLDEPFSINTYMSSYTKKHHIYIYDVIYQVKKYVYFCSKNYIVHLPFFKGFTNLYFYKVDKDNSKLSISDIIKQKQPHIDFMIRTQLDLIYPNGKYSSR